MKIYLFLIISFYSAVCLAQSISGSYQYKNEDNSVIRILTFSKTHFKEELKGDLTAKTGGGTYSIKNKQLKLNYQEVSNKDTSKYEISASAKSNTSSLIDLRVFDREGTPLIAIYGCRDTKNNPLALVNTDTKGYGNMMIYETRSIGYFTVDCIGYRRILIPIKKLMGKTVNIKAYLSPLDEVYIEPHIVQFRISDVTEKKLVLLDNDQTLTFEKIK